MGLFKYYKMNIVKDTLFYSKILLFGEYGIIEDSMGLSIPYNEFYGHLTFENKGEVTEKSNFGLKKLCKYLIDLQEKKTLLASIDLKKFNEDLENGMSFDSSIPQGFGVGSSGALVAAVYAKYVANQSDSSEWNKGDKILQLKKELGQIESFYHGKSSGLDPLICYLKLPVLITSKDEVGLTAIPDENISNGAIFLLNSGTPGSTSSMVSIFMEKCKEHGFRNMVKTSLKKYNDACITAFLNKDEKPLFFNLKKLSKLFLENFQPMIPANLEEVWKKGLETNTYYLKLCGSGGGGYILGFTRNLAKTQKMLAGQDMSVVCHL